jgi:acyl carrier protein
MNSDNGENGRLAVSAIHADRGGVCRGQSLTMTEVQDLLVAKFAEVAGVDPGQVDIHEPIFSYGVGSIQLLNFVGDLEDYFDLRLPPTLALEYPTIEGVTEFVWAEIERGRKSVTACNEFERLLERFLNERKASDE